MEHRTLMKLCRSQEKVFRGLTQKKINENLRNLRENKASCYDAKVNLTLTPALVFAVGKEVDTTGLLTTRS